jgi:hypothetical protein
MSNINGSMDYRGFDISGQGGEGSGITGPTGPAGPIGPTGPIGTVNPACFGWYDCGTGNMPPSNIITNILIPSFVQTGGLPQINSPIVNFTYDVLTGIITCNETGVYLICQSYDVFNPPNPTQFGWTIGLRNRTSGRIYIGARKNGTFSDPNAGLEFWYGQTTYDTLTAGTQLNFCGQNADPINSVDYRNIFLTIFRLA